MSKYTLLRFFMNNYIFSCDVKSLCSKITLESIKKISTCDDNIYLSGKDNLAFCKFCGVAQTWKLDHLSSFTSELLLDVT